MTLHNTHLQSALPLSHLDDSSFNLAFRELSDSAFIATVVALKRFYLILLSDPSYVIRPLSSYRDLDSFVTRLPMSKYVVEEVSDRLDYEKKLM